MLVLQGVGQLVSQHRLLLLHIHPVQHGDGLGFGVVIGFDLFFEQLQQKGLEGEVAVQQAELLQHNLAALHAFGALVFLELLFEVAFHRGARGDLALDRALDGQPGFVGGKLDQLIDQREELLRLLGCDLACWRGLRLRCNCGRLLLGRSRQCRKAQHRSQCPSAN